MLLNHPAPGEDGFALGTLASPQQVPCGRGEALQGGLEKASPFAGKTPRKRCLARPRGSGGTAPRSAGGLGDGPSLASGQPVGGLTALLLC